MLSSFLASPSPALPVNGKGVCPSPALPVNGEGVSPRFLGAAVSPRPNDGPAIMSWCGGIKGGTGVALMVTLGFGRAGVEMLRSAQHDRLVPMNDAYERSRVNLNPRFIE